MKARIIALAAGALLWGAAQASLFSTWSEVTGTRYHRMYADRWPARIAAVGENPLIVSPYRVSPGVQRVTVESPRHDGFAGTLQDFVLDIEPCRRYYVNAQFDGPSGSAWRPVIDAVEVIPGCRVPAS